MRRLAVALTALILLRADMYQDGSNAQLPQARQNLGVAQIMPQDYGAKCDVKLYDRTATWTAGGTSFTPGGGITPAAADAGKKLVVYGAGPGGATYVGTITAAVGAAWTVSPALTQASGLSGAYAAQVATPQAGAGSYAPGNTITVTGGTVTGGSQPVLTVKYTKVVSLTIASGGSGGVEGNQIVRGATGVGPRFEANVTVTGGAVTAINSLITGGSYMTNPTNPAAETVTSEASPGLTGATFNLKMGVAQVIPTSPGGYGPAGAPANPVAQGATSGSGTGATFNLQIPFNNYGHGWWYYGTDDGPALQQALNWAKNNYGTVKLDPKQWCGTTQTLLMDGDFARLEGETMGYAEANLPLAWTPYSSTLFWMGAQDLPLVLIEAPNGLPRRQGNTLRRLSLICGNRAGYALQLKSAVAGSLTDLYTQQCTKAGIEFYTNTNASSPQDTQFYDVNQVLINQENSNGMLMRLDGDPSVGSGDTSVLNISNVHGWVGNDTGIELKYTDNNFFRHILFYRPSFSGALYDWDFWGHPNGFWTYGNRIDYSGGQVIARGTDSSGDGGVFTKMNTFVYFSETNPNPLIEPGAQFEYKSYLLETNKTLTEKLVTGLPAGGQLYSSRNTINNSTSSIAAADITMFSGGSAALLYGLKYDYNRGYVHTDNGYGFALRADGAGTVSMLGTPSSTAGSQVGFGGQLWSMWTGTAHGGVQIGSPTGGDCGLGCLSATSIKVDPASPASSAACSAGMMKTDATYIYVCTAANTWKRAALAAY